MKNSKRNRKYHIGTSQDGLRQNYGTLVVNVFKRSEYGPSQGLNYSLARSPCDVRRLQHPGHSHAKK